MTVQHGLKRKKHFILNKIKTLQRHGRLAFEDPSIRYTQIDTEAGRRSPYYCHQARNRAQFCEQLSGKTHKLR